MVFWELKDELEQLMVILTPVVFLRRFLEKDDLFRSS